METQYYFRAMEVYKDPLAPEFARLYCAAYDFGKGSSHLLHLHEDYVDVENHLVLINEIGLIKERTVLVQTFNNDEGGLTWKEVKKSGLLARVHHPEGSVLRQMEEEELSRRSR